MTQKSGVKEQAKDILEENLDKEAVIVLARISEEMQFLFTAHPEPSRDEVERIVTGFFLKTENRNSLLMTGSRHPASIAVPEGLPSMISRKLCFLILGCSGL